jgi:hypothetical protein
VFENKENDLAFWKYCIIHVKRDLEQCLNPNCSVDRNFFDFFENTGSPLL